MLLAKRNGLLSSLCCHTQREENNPFGEITLELYLVFEIAESGRTINGLIGGLKQAVGQIHGAIFYRFAQLSDQHMRMLLAERTIGSSESGGAGLRPVY